MLKWGLCPYIFLINNEGYEIERQIHGRQAKYNEIQPYDHQMLLPFLAGKSCQVSPGRPPCRWSSVSPFLLHSKCSIPKERN